MAREFKGKIELDVRNSTWDWSAFLPDKAPDGALAVMGTLPHRLCCRDHRAIWFGAEFAAESRT